MTEANDPGRILTIVFDNLVQHRKTLFDQLNKKCQEQVRILLDIEQKATDAELKRRKFNPGISTLVASTNEIQVLSERIGFIDVQLANIIGLGRGAYKYFGEPEKSKASNVTVLPTPTSSSAPKTTGSAPQAGTKQATDNPGLQRQRERRNTQNDK